jgi:zinc transporter 5/7
MIRKKEHKRQFHGPTLEIDGNKVTDSAALAVRPLPASAGTPASPGVFSPITPSYHFGHDDHYDTHHKAHIPNLNKPSLGHHQSHEGHSHNMRGVFLHVMAVRALIRNC